MKSGNVELPRHLQTWLAAKIEEERMMELLKQGSKDRTQDAKVPRRLQTWFAAKMEQKRVMEPLKQAAKIEEERVLRLLKQGFTFSYQNTKKDAFKAVDQWNKRHPHNICKCISYKKGGCILFS